MRGLESGCMNSNTPPPGFKGATVPCEKGARIKILLADDHRMVSQGLRHLLEREPDLELVGEADNGAGAVRLAGELKPDVIVMEARLPRLSSADVVRQIKRFERPLAVLILTEPGDDDRALELLQAGADGCIFKTASCGDLAQAIRVIMVGQFICDLSLERKLLKYISRAGSAAPGGVEQLTPREIELLKLAALGLNNQDIASRMVLTVGTVKGYFAHIFTKMYVRSRTEAVMEGLKRGWVSLDNK
jgi:DNA-binding NarL/FixJ family response regulator